MISLTYLSTATEALSAPELEALLEVSRRRNAEAGVTGLLLYADAHFVQTLEGQIEDVRATMERILVDPRHHDVDIALTYVLRERDFPDWSMGFDEVGAEHLRSRAGFVDYVTAEHGTHRHVDRLSRAGAFHRIFRDAHGPEA